MSFIRLQGNKEQGVYFEYDPASIALGEGGMGKVFKGYCVNEKTGHRREVAIKFLYSDLPSHVIARARREAAVQLRNDNLIEMIGFLETAEKDVIGKSVIRYHVVSEYLHGVTLDNLLEGKITDYKGEIIPFAKELYGKFLNNPYNFAIMIVRSILSGLMALHDAGYIHRDIDPSNIMVTSDGHIKLIDFGIAKRINGNNTKESSYTVDGQFIGKPKYAAPELVRGLIDSEGPCTDLYAVGILFYQLITGKVPFDGQMAEVLDMQLNKKMPLKNIKQKAVRNVIKIATQKKISLRYKSAAEFRVAVDTLVPLTYPERPINYAKILLTSASSILFLFIVVEFVDYMKEEKSPEVVESSYEQALTMLKNESDVKEGFEMLNDLSAKEDAQSVYLLSRLYFESGEESDKSPDSLVTFRNRLSVKIDNKKAHNLLLKAARLDENNYKILYELGCDYKSNKRGTSRNSDSAYYFFEKALNKAEIANDKYYLKMIKDKMSNLSKPAEKLNILL